MTSFSQEMPNTVVFHARMENNLFSVFTVKARYGTQTKTKKELKVN